MFIDSAIYISPEEYGSTVPILESSVQTQEHRRMVERQNTQQFIVKQYAYDPEVGDSTLLRIQRLQSLDELDRLVLEDDEIAIIEIISHDNGKPCSEFITVAKKKFFTLDVIANVEHPHETVLCFPKAGGSAEHISSFLTEAKTSQTGPGILTKIITQPNTKYFKQDIETAIRTVLPGINLEENYRTITIEQFLNTALQNNEPVDSTVVAAIYKLQIQLSRHKQRQYKAQVKESLKRSVDDIEAELDKRVHQLLPDIFISQDDLALFDENIADSMLGFQKTNPWFTVEKRNGKDMVIISDHEALMCAVEIDDAGEVFITLNMESAAASLNQNTALLPGGGMKVGEDPKECAKRELEEELHKTVSKNPSDTVYIATLNATSLISGSHSHVVLTRNFNSLEGTHLTDAQSRADEQHRVHKLRITLNQAEELILKGYVSDSRTIAGICLAKQWMKNNYWLPLPYVNKSKPNIQQDAQYVQQYELASPDLGRLHKRTSLPSLSPGVPIHRSSRRYS